MRTQIRISRLERTLLGNRHVFSLKNQKYKRDVAQSGSVSRLWRDGRLEIMGYLVYILFSEKLNRYYVGQTNYIVKRLAIHNRGGKKYTSKGRPWILVKTYPCNNRSEAVQLEGKVKKRGIERYFEEN